MWKAIYNKIESQAFIEQVKEIAGELIDKTNNFQNKSFGLYGGIAGRSIFFGYLTKITGKDKYLNHFNILLSSTWEGMEKEALSIPLSSGFTGMAWTFNHLIKQNIWLADPILLLSNLDQYILEGAENYLCQNNYDFMHGGLGAAVYFLDRLPNDFARNSLERIVTQIKRLAIYDGDDIYWKSVDFETGEDILNLGLSHGMPSIIAILSLIHEVGIAFETTGELVTGNIKWILKQELSSEYTCAFPSIIRGNGEVLPTRLSWCYGDLGIALSLWHAGRAFKNKDLKNHAIRIVSKCTPRKKTEKNSILDAGLCHGAMSIAHIYNRFYQYTYIEQFKDAARFWYEETFKFKMFDDGIAGFKTYRSEKYGGMQPDPGLLEGASGIGLGLLAAVSDIEPAWDRCLLIS